MMPPFFDGKVVSTRASSGIGESVVGSSQKVHMPKKWYAYQKTGISALPIPTPLLIAFLAIFLQGCSHSDATHPASNSVQTPQVSDATPIMEMAPTVAPTKKPATPTPKPRTTPIPGTSRETVLNLLRKADGLYEEASSIANLEPETKIAADILVGGETGPIGIFYKHDRTFQDSLPHVQPDDNGISSAISNLAEFEAFVYATAVSTTQCNHQDALHNLKVAKTFLDESHRDINGTASDSWTPPGGSGEVSEDPDSCSDAAPDHSDQSDDKDDDHSSSSDDN